MKKKHNKTKRYIVIEFDGTTTRACTFRSPDLIIISNAKGLHESQAKLHPDDVYDQNTGLRLALERIGFEIGKNPFDVIFERFGKALENLVIFGDTSGDSE